VLYGLFYALTIQCCERWYWHGSLQVRVELLAFFISWAAWLCSLQHPDWRAMEHYGPRLPFYLSAGPGGGCGGMLLIPLARAERNIESPHA